MIGVINTNDSVTNKLVLEALKMHPFRAFCLSKNLSIPLVSALFIYELIWSSYDKSIL